MFAIDCKAVGSAINWRYQRHLKLFPDKIWTIIYSPTRITRTVRKGRTELFVNYFQIQELKIR